MCLFLDYHNDISSFIMISAALRLPDEKSSSDLIFKVLRKFPINKWLRLIPLGKFPPTFSSLNSSHRNPTYTMQYATYEHINLPNTSSFKKLHIKLFIAQLQCATTYLSVIVLELLTRYWIKTIGIRIWRVTKRTDVLAIGGVIFNVCLNTNHIRGGTNE